MTSSNVVNRPDIYISGDVRIDPLAVIAPGVVLQASPNSYIAIASGACLGMGTIVQAHQGHIKIETGAMVAAAVLIIGQSTIGANACIGYGTTIFRASILAGTVIPPNSLIGDLSRRAPIDSPVQSQAKSTEARKTQRQQTTNTTADDPWTAGIGDRPSTASTSKHESIIIPEMMPDISSQENPLESPQEISTTSQEFVQKNNPDAPKAPVVGQVYINQLLMTLFPHQQPLNPPENSS